MTERDAHYYLANYDAASGLPNRHMLHRRIDEALRRGDDLAVIVTELDGLNEISNTLGRAVGERVLADVGRRIGFAVIDAGITDSGLLARIGDEELAMLFDHCDPLMLTSLARAINAVVAEPIAVDGHEIRIVGNSGMAIAPDHGAYADELMGSAELALRHARNRGRGGAFLFIPNLRAEAVARRMYDAELHGAFERGEFVLYYQPHVRLADSALTGAEALIRWQHPMRGLLAPAAFLPALEDGTLADPVGRWVIETACAQAAAWRRVQPDFCMSLNLSGALFRSGDLPEMVERTLKAHDLPASSLKLELTENIILDQQDRVLAQLQKIRALGVRLSFDDFGTGFASLNVLRTFPVTHIKIDKGFIGSIQTSQKDRVIVASLLDMAGKLGLQVIAEGVETRADADFLRAQGCETAQGFLFGRPMPAEAFAARFLAGKARRRA